ncbi:MAG: squalene synthase HpnC [Thalassobaculum sp.]
MQIDQRSPPTQSRDGRPNRTAETENFPVASLLMARDLRPAVMAYYDVARAADDIADDAHLPAAEKLRLLDRIDAALTANADDRAEDLSRAGDGWTRSALATAIRASQALSAHSVPVEHATRLLVAFRRDAVQPRTTDWSDLMDYCANSAAPVGRFLLDLHGEDPDHRPASDALCSALQVLNHLQDCGDDYRSLDRIYLPTDWLAEEGVPDSDLAAPRSSAGLRRVLDRCLGEVAALLTRARPLPGRLRSVRLALETAVILALADTLAGRLAASDPLAGRVQVPKPAMLGHAALAVSKCLWQRAFLSRSGLA